MNIRTLNLTFYAKTLFTLVVTLEPLGFVLATGLHPLVSETASHVSECLRLRLAPNRLMSLLQELVLRAVIR